MIASGLEPPPRRSLATPDPLQSRDPQERRTARLAAAAVAAIAALPFLRGLVAGGSFYFRDLAGEFLPLRRFALEGLLRGELRFWNPYVHEGVPLLPPPVSYPVDLLQLLAPDEWGISLVLALHVPLAALALWALARRLGCSPVASAGGALVYALGGFALSTLNLYRYLHALSWAPLVVLGLIASASGGRRAVAAGAVAVGVALSTTGAEIALQALLLGLLLALAPLDARRAGRVAASIALGAALAAPVLLQLRGFVADSARSHGFPVEVALSHSIHPLTWLQVMIGDLYGRLGDLVDTWWGSNFFPRGFPYVLSLYLGATALALAAVGALRGAGPRRRLLLAAAVAAVVALGRWAGLTPLVEALEPVRVFRYPTKAFFTIHFAGALLVALGVDALRGVDRRRAGHTLAFGGLALGGVLVALPLLPALLPAGARLFADGFFPPGTSPAGAGAQLGHVLSDAARGGALALVAGTIGLLVARQRLRLRAAGPALVALIAVDLLRTGAGLNPMVTRRFFELSPQTAARAAAFTRSGARIFTCDASLHPRYAAARRARPRDHELLSFALWRESLVPNTNVPLGVASGLSLDLTMLVPRTRVLAPREAACTDPDALVPLLRRAAVSHVLSIEPLRHRELIVESVLSPPQIAPLAIFVHALARPLPRAALLAQVQPATSPAQARALAAEPGFQHRGGAALEGASRAVSGARGDVIELTHAPGRIVLSVEADRPSAALVREAHAAGWRARLDGEPAPVLRADGRHMAVEVPAGRSEIELRYRPPSLSTGLAASGLAVLALALLAGPWRRRPARAGGEPRAAGLRD